MEELFRFSVVRAGQTSDRVRVVVEDPQSALLPRLAVARSPSERRELARAFRSDPGGFARLDQIPRAVQLLEVRRRLIAAAPRTRAEIATAVSAGLDGISLGEAIGLKAWIADLFLSLYLAPPRPFSAEARETSEIALVADLLRVVYLLELLDTGAPLLDEPGALELVFEAPLLVPAMAAGPEPRLHPVGTIDLLVVKQQLTRYEGAEVARVETVMRGEERVHRLEHTLATERETTTETEQATETTEERESTEQTKLSQEVSRSLSEQVGVKAGLELGYGSAPSFFIRANAGVSYERATQESSKLAQEVATSVTKRAASKVSTSNRLVERRRVLETFADRQKQAFSNRTGNEHLRGVYQFLEQVLTCQVYNYSSRTIYDVTVPDPGAYLRRRAAAVPAVANGVVEPWALTEDGRFDPQRDQARLLKPTDALEDATQWFHYAALAARYGVIGLVPPPAPMQVAKAYAQPLQATETRVLVAESLDIPAGYQVRQLRVIGMWNGKSDDTPWTVADVFIGDHQIPLRIDRPAAGEPIARLGGPFTIDIDPSTRPLLAPGPLALSIEGHPSDHTTVTELALNVIAHYEPTADAIARWRHETYDRIAGKYQELRREFEDARAASAFGASRRSIGRTPLENRALEREELKKAVLALMIGRPFEGYAADVLHPGTPPEPYLPAPLPSSPSFELDMATTRFVEQAFEWENMSFVLYPYFWKDSARWQDAFEVTEDDPRLAEFMRAGAARVVLPVRRSFEDDVVYFLTYEYPWLGGALPKAEDPRYFDVVDEQRARANAPGDETPVGEPWELRVATTAVWLRGDDRLPEWVQPDPARWSWTAKLGLP